MPTIVDKDVVVPLLRREFAAIAKLCEDLDEADWDTPTCLPGWSVKDQLSHIIGTEAMLDGEQAPDVDISHLTHIKNDIGRFNELWVESLRPLDGAEVLQRFREVTARRLAALEAMSQADLDAPSFTPVGRDETYGRFMRIRHYDCFLHEHDMRDAVGREDRADPEALALVLDEVAAGLGYVVGKKAAMPEGARVRIEVTGEADRQLDYEVGDRAELVDHHESDPTVVLRLPALLFLRLTGGRTDPEPHVGEDVELGGDQELARRLATNLAYTI
jgi:uncharacterized protein (TIGR03083 family)